MNRITVHNRKFDNWNEFREAVNASNAKRSIFRGQRDPNWKLASLWERHVARLELPIQPDKGAKDFFIDGDYTKNRDNYRALFKEQLEKIQNHGKGMTGDQLWGIGRHYGLVTPLLDWTYDPLVAAYFAMVDCVRWVCAEDLDEQEEKRRRSTSQYTAIWRLATADGLFKDAEFELVNLNDDGEFSSRIRAQKGVFTKLTSDHHVDVQAYLASRRMTSALECLQLSSATISDALAVLHDEGIHHAVLFPDPYGAAAYANLRKFIKPQSMSEMK